ncbi:RNA polymerase II-associated protein 3, partial [Biomphalaria glabrata]
AHEVETTEDGTSAFQKIYDNCKKNPGHADLIPVQSFSLHHLPDGHRSQNLYDMIKATAELTVRIGVSMVSPKRPEFFPHTNVTYPFYNKGGYDKNRIGTGDITVFKYKKGFGCDAFGSKYNRLGKKYRRSYKRCLCDKCQHSKKPSKVWWEILFNTATHVVFDEIEAEHTSCRLFFDAPGSPKVIVDKVVVDFVSVEMDMCVLKHVTCDDTLGPRLSEIVKTRGELWDKVREEYVNLEDDKLSFIVSHPHGGPKMVSVGQLIENCKVGEYNDNVDITKLTYSTCTCPGSSGARVRCVGLDSTHVHNGALKPGQNYSSIDFCLKEH